MSDDLKIDQTLDTKGLSCPIPILKTQRAMNGMTKDQVLKVLTTDPGSQKDMPAWANRTGHQIVKVEAGSGVYTFFIRKTK